MAIYHLNAKLISRGKGKSATAAAAYRAGQKIYDERLGMTFDYSRKSGIYATEILAPPSAPDWVKDREKLWNQVELGETRKNSRLAREFDIALPVELTHDEKRDLVRGFVNDLFVSQNLVADVAFHNMDSHNPHVHILLTTRTIKESGFTEKLRSLDKKEFLLELRQSWEDYANKALDLAGVYERIDHRSLEEQGLNRIPQIHKGSYVSACLLKGIQTERGDKYLSIEEANREIEGFEEELATTETLIKVEEKAIKIAIAYEAKAKEEKASRSEAPPQPKLTEPKSVSQDEVARIISTANEAVEKYGYGSRDEKTFNNPYYKIEKIALLGSRGWEHSLTVTALDDRVLVLVLSGDNPNTEAMKIRLNRLNSQDTEQFKKMQTVFDNCQQIREFKHDAEFILHQKGNLSKGGYGRGTSEGQNYRIISDKESFRVEAKDGRGEILNFSNDPRDKNAIFKATKNFTPDDVEVFRDTVTQIKEEIEADKQRQSERAKKKQQRGRDLER